MKNILLAIKSKMANAIEINTMIIEINRLREQATEQLLPLVSKFADSYDGSYKSGEIKTLGYNLARANKDIDKDKFLGDIAAALSVVGRESEILLTKLEDENIHAVMAESLDVKHALALQFITVSEFLCEFTRAILISTAEFENAAYQKAKTDSSMMKYYQNTFTGQHIGVYANAVAYFMSKRRDDIVEDVYKLPEIKVDESVLTAVAATQSAREIDPSGLSALSLLHVINPIAWIYGGRKIWSELKLTWAQNIESELEYLQIRHQELLEAQQNGDSTLGTKRRIEKYRDEIDVQRGKLKRLKKRLGDGDA